MYVTPDRLIEGELIERRRADNIYQSIVNSRRDPAILEQIGDNLFKMRVFPIFPKDTKRILLDFTLPLEGEQGEYTFRIPLLSDLQPIWDLRLSGTVCGRDEARDDQEPVASGDGGPALGTGEGHLRVPATERPAQGRFRPAFPAGCGPERRATELPGGAVAGGPPRIQPVCYGGIGAAARPVAPGSNLFRGLGSDGRLQEPPLRRRPAPTCSSWPTRRRPSPTCRGPAASCERSWPISVRSTGSGSWRSMSPRDHSTKAGAQAADRKCATSWHGSTASSAWAVRILATACMNRCGALKPNPRTAAR